MPADDDEDEKKKKRNERDERFWLLSLHTERRHEIPGAGLLGRAASPAWRMLCQDAALAGHERRPTADVADQHVHVLPSMAEA